MKAVRSMLAKFTQKQQIKRNRSPQKVANVEIRLLLRFGGLKHYYIPYFKTATYPMFSFLPKED